MKNKVKELRKTLKITQEQFAKKVGISRPALSAIENGTVPKGLTMFKIARELNRSIDDIFFNKSVVWTKR